MSQYHHECSSNAQTLFSPFFLLCTVCRYRRNDRRPLVSKSAGRIGGGYCCCHQRRCRVEFSDRTICWKVCHNTKHCLVTFFWSSSDFKTLACVTEWFQSDCRLSDTIGRRPMLFASIAMTFWTPLVLFLFEHYGMVVW